MRKLVLTIQDKDHFTEQWSFAQKGTTITGCFSSRASSSRP